HVHPALNQLIQELRRLSGRPDRAHDLRFSHSHEFLTLYELSVRVALTRDPAARSGVPTPGGVRGRPGGSATGPARTARHSNKRPPPPQRTSPLSLCLVWKGTDSFLKAWLCPDKVREDLERLRRSGGVPPRSPSFY